MPLQLVFFILANPVAGLYRCFNSTSRIWPALRLGALLGAVALWAANRRKRRQRAASAPEGILRAELNLATQIAGIGVWRMDIATGVTTIDASLQRMLGLEDDLGGGRIPVHPDDRERTNGALYKAMHETADVVSLRMRIVQRSGKVRHFQTHFRKLRGPGQGEVIGVSRDITDEVEQAEHARVLAERLNIATEAAGISCWELDLQTRRFLWIENPLLDTSSAEPNASLDSYRQRMHAADRLNVEALLAAALESGQERISYHYRIVSNNGKLLYVQIHARFIRSDKHSPRLLGVSWDATREIEAAEQLEQQARHERMLRDRLSMSTEAAGISCWEIDLDQQRVVVVDQGVRALHLLSNFDGSVEEFFSHVHLDDRGNFTDALKQTLRAGGNHFACRYRMLAADGNPIHIQTHARIVGDDSGRACRLFGVSWDVTKEIGAAERLRNQAEMLRDAERRLERASLSSSEGHWEFDLEQQRVWYSSSYHTLLGYQDGELPRIGRCGRASRAHPTMSSVPAMRPIGTSRPACRSILCCA